MNCSKLTTEQFVRGFVQMMQGEQELEKALKRVEENADERWKAVCLDVIQALCLAESSFTTDDVWQCLGSFDVSTHEPRTMGAMMRQAVKNGWCEPTDSYKKSSRAVCHARPLRVWRSLLIRPDSYDGGTPQ